MICIVRGIVLPLYQINTVFPPLLSYSIPQVAVVRLYPVITLCLAPIMIFCSPSYPLINFIFCPLVSIFLRSSALFFLLVKKLESEGDHTVHMHKQNEVMMYILREEI